MIRKLILPVAALLLLAGCATGYSYRTAPGDYYYGRPATVYRDYYGYPSYYSPYGWSGYYSYRYGYGYPYGYYRYPHYHGYPHSPRPGDGDGDDRPADRATPPWRDLGRLGADASRPTVPGAEEFRRPVRRPVQQVQQAPTRVARPRIETRQQPRGSAMSEMIRRANPIRDGRRNTDE